MTQEKKGIVVDPEFITNEINELMKHPVVQKLIYLQTIVKQQEEVPQEQKLYSKTTNVKSKK